MLLSSKKNIHLKNTPLPNGCALPLLVRAVGSLNWGEKKNQTKKILGEREGPIGEGTKKNAKEQNKAIVRTALPLFSFFKKIERVVKKTPSYVITHADGVFFYHYVYHLPPWGLV